MWREKRECRVKRHFHLPLVWSSQSHSQTFFAGKGPEIKFQLKTVVGRELRRMSAHLDRFKRSGQKHLHFDLYDQQEICALWTYAANTCVFMETKTSQLWFGTIFMKFLFSSCPQKEWVYNYLILNCIHRYLELMLRHYHRYVDRKMRCLRLSRWFQHLGLTYDQAVHQIITKINDWNSSTTV